MKNKEYKLMSYFIGGGRGGVMLVRLIEQYRSNAVAQLQGRNFDGRKWGFVKA